MLAIFVPEIDEYGESGEPGQTEVSEPSRG